MTRYQTPAIALLHVTGLVTLEEMKEKRETLVREREIQIAAKLKSEEAYVNSLESPLLLFLPP